MFGSEYLEKPIVLGSPYVAVTDTGNGHVAYVHEEDSTYVLSALLAYGPKLPRLLSEPSKDSGLCGECTEYGTVVGPVYCGQKVQEGKTLCPAHVQEWNLNYPDKPLH